MKSFSKFLIILLAVGCFSISGRAQDQQEPMTLQDAINGYESVTNGDAGVPEDWSTHHLIFSQAVPGTAASDKVMHDPRYWTQQIRRSRPESDASAAPDADEVQADAVSPDDRSNKKKKKAKDPKAHLKRDWAVSMGTGTHGTAGVYPAKYGFGPSTATCEDYAVFPTAVTGTASIPNIIAYNKLYEGASPLNCNTGTPSVFWQASFEVSSTYGTVATSPALSGNGQQIAFIATVSSHAYLVVLLMPNADDTSVVSITCPSSTNVNNVSQTTAPQAWCAEFGDANNDSNSSPFYDFANNVLYVGDNSGVLHKFQNVFHSTNTTPNTTVPSEVTGGGTGSGWPQTMGSTALTSPVYDNGASGRVFVGDAGGSLYSIPAGGGSTPKNTSNRIGFGTIGIVDTPIVDPSTEKVYAFVGCDVSGCTGSGANGGVFQFAATFASSTSGIEESIGSAALTSNIYAGAFNNTYYTGSGTTGDLYVCGYHSTGTIPRLFYIPMNSTFTGTVGNTTTDPASTAATCSPVTEICNPGTSGSCASGEPGGNGADWIFLSVTANGGAAGCTGACVYNYNVTATPSNSTTGLASTGGSSGIIIDNVVSNSGASQIYYETLGTTNAVQASQSAP